VTQYGGGELRHIVAGVDLPGDVEGATFILREPLELVHEEEKRVVGGLLVSALVVVGSRV